MAWTRSCSERAASGRMASAFIQHPSQLLGGDARVLHRIGGLLMPQLLLHGGDIPSFLNNVFAHRMAGRMGGFAGDAGDAADRVPDVINGQDGKSAATAP